MKSLSLSLGSKPPWLVLFISLTISFFAAYITNLQSQKTGQERFQRQVEMLNADILHHLNTYLGLLRAGVGVHYASEFLSRDEWKQFVETLEVERFYPGIQGIGFAQYFNHVDRERFETAMKAEGFSDFQMLPPEARDHYAPVTYLEPFDWRNQRAFGYDMFTETVRRKAMEHARDTGEASISGHVVLVQETEKDVQSGFLMYLPVYSLKAVPLTVEERRSSLQGFVYAPFRMKKLLSEIGSNSASELIYHISDVAEDDSNIELFHSDPKRKQMAGSFYDQRDMPFAGRVWQITTTSTQFFDSEQSDNSTALVFIAGLIDSILLFFMALTLVSHRRTAQENSERLSEQLHRSLKFQQMADSAPTALITVNKHGLIDLYNQQALQLFGYTETELKGLSVDDLVPHRFSSTKNAAGKNPLEPQTDQAQTSVLDLYCKTKNGVELPVEVAIMPAHLNNSGHTVYSILNISERKRQEDLLRRKSSDLEQFVYAVSHDLKSPLVAISGLSDLISNTLTEHPNNEISFWVERISANAGQMERLLDDLLEVSRVAYKALELEPVSVSELAQQIQMLHRDLVAACDGKLNINAHGSIFNAHKTLFLQLYGNLIGNAIKYRSPDRPLEINVDIHVNEKGDLTSHVSDNGIGISPEWQRRVFDLFVRKGEGDGLGSGVGLSICKSVVERHHGTLSIDSTVGIGTTFYVSIPALTGNENELGE